MSLSLYPSSSLILSFTLHVSSICFLSDSLSLTLHGFSVCFFSDSLLLLHPRKISSHVSPSLLLDMSMDEELNY
ncbi:hypothetical protein N665_0127s0003 [Sinapis alba]|nr:hypothetical protein N665_0127s0003 [Sinapis alba]